MASVFTQIIEGKIPGHFVWDDEQCVAIMTIQPVREGHVLVIPKAEIDHWDDVPDELSAHLYLTAKKVAKAIKLAFPSERVGLVIAGLEVPHTHLHLIPVNNMQDFDFSGLSFAEGDALADAAQKIRDALEA